MVFGNKKLIFDGTGWVGDKLCWEKDSLKFYAYYPYDENIADPAAISFNPPPVSVPPASVPLSPVLPEADYRCHYPLRMTPTLKSMQMLPKSAKMFFSSLIVLF